MKKLLLRTSFMLMLVLICLFTTSCAEKDGSGYLFRYNLTADPKNLDPQLATDTPSLVVIQNLYVGLFKGTPTGSITEGIATNYTVSADGLKYTISLNENYSWTGKDDFTEKVTADDFVFAFERIINPQTNSPYASNFYCIKNAERINKGILPLSELGVHSDEGNSLIIELEYTNAEFLSLLATTPAMPCNEKFFLGTKGTYGLETESTISNGAFFLSQWLHDPYGKENYLILRKNINYSAMKKVYPSGLNFFISKTETDNIKDFENDETDCIVNNGLKKDLFTKKNTAVSYESIASGLVFNLQNDIFKFEEVRKALAISINREAFSDKLPSSISFAYGIIPSGVTMLNKSFRELSAEPAKAMNNVALAQYLWESSLTKTEKSSLDGATILVPASYAFSDYLEFITEQWGEQLGFYCRIEVVPDSEFTKRINEGKYLIAISELKGNKNTPMSFLNTFKTGDNKNLTKYSDIDYDNILNEAEKMKSLSECVTKYALAEKYLVDNFIYVPIYFQKEYLIFDKKITDIFYNPFTKQIDFSLAKKF